MAQPTREEFIQTLRATLSGMTDWKAPNDVYLALMHWHNTFVGGQAMEALRQQAATITGAELTPRAWLIMIQQAIDAADHWGSVELLRQLVARAQTDKAIEQAINALLEDRQTMHAVGRPEYAAKIIGTPEEGAR